LFSLIRPLPILAHLIFTALIQTYPGNTELASPIMLRGDSF
jgi:hypothetical protein